MEQSRYNFLPYMGKINGNGMVSDNAGDFSRSRSRILSLGNGKINWSVNSHFN